MNLVDYKKIFKVIIAGSRDFNDYIRLEKELDYLLKDKIEEGYTILIVSGRAKGADQLGERYARNRNFDIEMHPADWNKYGRRAGMIRNSEMAYSGDALVAFWDGESRGTKQMISVMERLNKPLRIILYNGGD